MDAKNVLSSSIMQHRKTPTGEPEKGEAADGRRRLSMNSLESLYSLTSRQSSSSKHPKAGGQMHSSHSTLMNYATPLRHSHFTPLLTSDKAKPNPQPSWSTNWPVVLWKCGLSMAETHCDSILDLFTCGCQGGVTSSSDYFSNRDSLRLDDDMFAKQYCGRARVHTDFVPSPYDTESLSLKVNKKIDHSVFIVAHCLLLWVWVWTFVCPCVDCLLSIKFSYFYSL